MQSPSVEARCQAVEASRRWWRPVEASGGERRWRFLRRGRRARRWLHRDCTLRVELSVQSERGNVDAHAFRRGSKTEMNHIGGRRQSSSVCPGDGIHAGRCTISLSETSPAIRGYRDSNSMLVTPWGELPILACFSGSMPALLSAPGQAPRREGEDVVARLQRLLACK